MFSHPQLPSLQEVSDLFAETELLKVVNLVTEELTKRKLAAPTIAVLDHLPLTAVKMITILALPPQNAKLKDPKSFASKEKERRTATNVLQEEPEKFAEMEHASPDK